MTAARTLLITLAFPPQRGGMQRFMYQRARLTPDIVRVAAPNRGRADAWDAAQPFPIWRWSGGPTGVPGWRRARQVYGAWQAVRWARRAGGITGLELGQSLPFGLVGVWAQRHDHLPYTVWAFGDDVLKPAAHPLARPLLRLTLQRAQAVFAVSTYTAALVRAWVKESSPVHVVHPWPAPHFRPGDRGVARRALGLPEDVLLLLTVARLEPRKGVDRVLAVLPRLLSRFPHMRYAVVGEGSARKRWQALAQELGIHDHVLWPGDVTDERLVAWYQAADVFVLVPTPGPLEVEGFGLVYVEAGACGVPAVAGDNGGVREAVLPGKTGMVVPVDDGEALEVALSQLLQDEALRATMGQAALAHARRLREQASHLLLEHMR